MGGIVMSFIYSNTKKKIKLFIVPFFVFCLILNFRPVTAFAVNNNELKSGVLENSFILNNTDDTFTLKFIDNISGGHYYERSLTTEQIDNNNISYVFDNPAFPSIKNISFYNAYSRFQFDYLPNLYDYYMLVNIHNSTQIENTENQPFSFVPYTFKFLYGSYGSESPSMSSDILFKQYWSYASDTQNISIIAQIPARQDRLSSIPCGFSLDTMSGLYGSVPANLSFDGCIVAVPVSSGSAFSDVVRAIHQQSDFLGGKLDNIQSSLNSKLDALNNVLVNGDYNTPLYVNRGQQTASYFNEVLDIYASTEQQFIDGYLQSYEAISSDITNWSWGSLSLTASFIGDVLNTLFLVSGDFKQYFLFPIILGLFLFFIGRGSSIIGRLYRKPTETYTFSESSSSTKYVSGQRVTTSVIKTNRSGGVFRK